MQGEFTSFRVRFLPIAIPFAVFCVIVAVAAYCGAPPQENHEPIPLLLLLALPGIAALGAGIGMLTVFYNRVQVAPWGIRSFDIWGRYHDVPWDLMVKVTPFSLFCYRYLRVHRAGGGPALWLPLFLLEQQRFADLILHHAKPGNPLVNALKK